MRDALGHEDFRKLTSISSSCKLTLISQYSWESSQKPCTHVIEKHKTQCHSPGLSVTPVSPQLQPCPQVAAHPGSWAASPVTPGSSHPCPALCSSIRVTLGPQCQGAGEGATGPSAFLHGERCVLTDTIETFVFLSTAYSGGRKQLLTTLCIELHHKPSVYICVECLSVCGSLSCHRCLYGAITTTLSSLLWLHLLKQELPSYSHSLSLSSPMQATGFPRLFRTSKVLWNTSWVQWICRSLFGEWIP